MREFFAAATSALASGSAVDIKGVGTFRRSQQTDENGNFAVEFIPDQTVADEANRAFAMFEAVEIPAGFELPDDTEETTAPEETTPAPEPTAQPTASPEPAAEKEPDVAPSNDMQPQPEPQPAAMPEPAAKSEPTHLADKAPEPSFPEEETAETSLPLPPKQRNRTWTWVIAIAIIAGTAIGIAAGLLADVTPPPMELPADEYPADSTMDNGTILPDDGGQLQEAGTQTAANSLQNVEAAPQPATTQPEPAPAAQDAIYETVSASNYLSSMARRHYGAQIYWVYIYEANADHLGHPDRIAPGTRLLIPPRSSFPQASSEKEAREIAQRKANEIRARYSR